jgi:uncharacterized protein (DUF362 family)
MPQRFSRPRRNFLTLAGAGALACPATSLLRAQQVPTPALRLPVDAITPPSYRSTVSLVRGEDRRKNVHEALIALDAELRPELARRQYVFIKPNLTSVDVQLASTHPDAIRGILDYLDGRFKGPVVIGEAASNNTMLAFDNFYYNRLVSEYPRLRVSLIDLNEEGKYVVIPTMDSNVHLTAARIAQRNVDPDAFIVCAAIPKTHESMIMTAAVKNMVMGSPLRSSRKESAAWSDKRKIHVRGYQQHNYNIYMVAERLAPHWNLAVLDGYEGMEGNGPIRGDAVPHRIAIASRDFVAADRVAVEAMGVDPTWVGYLQYCGATGLGNYDLSRIDVRGETIASVARKYKMNSNFDKEIQWMSPLDPGPAPGPGRNG